MDPRMSHSEDGRKQTRRWLLLNVVLLTVVGLLSLSYPIEELSRRLGDLNFRWRGTHGTSRDVALVMIDDASLNRFGRWPWKRSMLARVVRATAAERPRAIGVDILLSEPEDESDDRELAEALKASGNVVLVSKINSAPQGRLWVDPLPLFAHSAVAVGHAQATLGPDSICRSVPVQELSLEGPRWAFALEIARVAQGVRLEDNGQSVRLGAWSIPTSGKSVGGGIVGVESESPRFLLINYRGQLENGESTPFTTVSVIDLLDGKSRGRLRGKAVLIGFGSTEIGDRVPTPVSGRIPMPGVEIHANLVDAILSGRGLRAIGAVPQLLLLLAFTLCVTWMILRWPVRRGLLALAALLAGVVASSYLLFSWAHLLLELGPFICAGVLAAPIAQLQNLILLDRDISEGLRHLQRALRTSRRERARNLSTALHPSFRSPARDLHWKTHLLTDLQAELTSLYAFDETLLEAMQDGLAVFVPDGSLVFHNSRWQSFCQRQGWTPLASLSEFVEKLGEPRWRNLQESLKEPGARLETEAHVGEGLYQFRAMRLSAGPQSSSTDSILVVVTDLTARLERDRARAEALGFVTHELRTPLVSIQGYAEYLLRYPRQAAGSDAAQTIFRESARLVAMIDTYLDVLRLEAGSLPLRREAFSLGASVDQIKQVLQPLARASEIRLKTEVSPEIPTLEGDPQLIAGALLNLLSNAVKYSPRGSEIRLRAVADGNMVALEVRNPGPVIPPQELDRLFEPFYRRREQESVARGWGLGLAFVKRIAEQHGGRVEASSGPDGGTCFRLLLPATRVLYSEALP